MTALRNAFVTMLTQLADDAIARELITLLRERPALMPTMVHVNRAIEEAVAERTGLSEDDLYVRTAAGAGFVAYRAAIALWPADSGADELVALMHRAMDVLEHGLAPPTA